MWSTSLPNRDALLHGQIIVGDALYFGVSRGIYAVSKSTGQSQWHYALEGRARALGLHDGTLIATDGNVYSLDPATGEVNWKYITGSDTQGVEWARIVDGTVYVRALNRHELYSIDASTGELNWKYAPGISEGRRLDPVTVEGDTVLVKQNAIIVSISVKTGEINWIYDAGDFPDFHIRPIIHKGVIYFFTRKDIVGIDETTGKVLLHRHTSMLFDEIQDETIKLRLTSGLFAEDKIHFGVNNLDVFALDEGMETVLWHYRYGGVPLSGGSSRYVRYAANGMVYLIQPFNYTRQGEVYEHVDGIYALDDWSGRRLWHFDSTGGVLDLTFHNDLIYVSPRENHPGSSFTGRIEAFDALTGELVRRVEFSQEDFELDTWLRFTISDGVLYGFGGNRVFALTVER